MLLKFLEGKTKKLIKIRHFQIRNNISSDELNRLRHFHYYVDFKGRLWRQEIDKPGKLFGFIKEGDLLDDFFQRVRPNNTNLYNDYPFVATFGIEKYFVTAKESPVVFTELLEHPADSLLFAYSLCIPFQPHELLLCTETNNLYHPINLPHYQNYGAHSATAPSSRAKITSKVYGLLEKNLTYYILNSCMLSSENDKVELVLELEWKGKKYKVKSISKEEKENLTKCTTTANPELTDCSHVQTNVRWWNQAFTDNK